MGEYDNARFPLTYLLSTASAIDQQKRMKALSAWAQCLRNQYGVIPIFIHSDKDMAEIGCAKSVWEVKVNLCWWHLRRAVRTHLAKAKLSTSPYNVDRARTEYKFINADFIPAGTMVDVEDYEGGNPDNDIPLLVDTEPQPLTATTPTTHSSVLQAQPPLGNVTSMLQIKLPLPNIASAIGRMIQGTGFRLSIRETRLPTIEEEAEDAHEAAEDEREVSDEEEDDSTPSRRTFCPLLYREPIINMMERHYCAHPSIPGSSPPDVKLIKQWAV